MNHEAITREIIGSAMKVLNTLRPGLDEKLYEHALVLELMKRGFKTVQQKEFVVHYEGAMIGKLVPDLIVAETVLVDTKVVTDFSDTHLSQMLGYLSITGLTVGLLVNFKYAALRVKRVSR